MLMDTFIKKIIFLYSKTAKNSFVFTKKLIYLYTKLINI